MMTATLQSLLEKHDLTLHQPKTSHVSNNCDLPPHNGQRRSHYGRMKLCILYPNLLYTGGSNSGILENNLEYD